MSLEIKEEISAVIFYKNVGSLDAKESVDVAPAFQAVSSAVSPDSINVDIEGIHSIVPIRWYLDTWIAEFTDYLKSAMSYTNHKGLETFVGGVLWGILSPTAIRTFK